MKLDNVIRGLRKGFDLNKQYFAITVNIDNYPTDEVIITHYSALDEKLEYITNTYNENCVHKFAKNVVITDYVAGDDFLDIQIALGLKEVSF